MWEVTSVENVFMNSMLNHLTDYSIRHLNSLLYPAIPNHFSTRHFRMSVKAMRFAFMSVEGCCISLKLKEAKASTPTALNTQMKRRR